MTITIDATPKEIAALVLELQERQEVLLDTKKLIEALNRPVREKSRQVFPKF